MKIYTKQIDSVSLTDFINETVSGGFFSGQLSDYIDANGYFGPNLVYTSGGNQIISGLKTFATSPLVPYSGGTGAVTSRKYIDDQDIAVIAGFSGDYVNLFLATKAFVTDASGALSKISITGSTTIHNPIFTGMGGTLVIRSGNFVLISGAGSAGGGISGATDNGNGINLSGNLAQTGQSLFSFISNVSGNLIISGQHSTNNALNLSGKLVETGGLLSAIKVTGSNTLQNPNFTGIGGTIVFTSGNAVCISGGGGGGVFVTNNTYNATGTGNIYFTSTGNTVTNTINITSGTVFLTGASSISVTGSSVMQFPNFTGVGGTLVIRSGNFVLISGGAGSSAPVASNASYDMSFFLDSVQIGDNLFETFVSNNYTVSGVAFGCRTTGSAPLNGGILTGKIYQVDFNNTEQTILNFTFNTGVKYAISGSLNVLVTGKNRVGLSITNTISSIQNFTVGVFGA